MERLDALDRVLPVIGGVDYGPLHGGGQVEVAAAGGSPHVLDEFSASLAQVYMRFYHLGRPDRLLSIPLLD